MTTARRRDPAVAYTLFLTRDAHALVADAIRVFSRASLSWPSPNESIKAALASINLDTVSGEQADLFFAAGYTDHQDIHASTAIRLHVTVKSVDKPRLDRLREKLSEVRGLRTSIEEAILFAVFHALQQGWH